MFASGRGRYDDPGIKRAGNSIVVVCERVGKSVISVCKKSQKG